MARFFVPPEWLAVDPVRLTGPLAHQLGRVLRLRPGDRIALLDDSGWEYEAELLALGPREATARIVGRSRPATEPRRELILHPALPKGKKLDWVLQKGTELGATCFAPLLSRYCVPQGGEEGAARLERWRRIVAEAAEQSGRARLPRVLAPVEFAAACAEASASCPGAAVYSGALHLILSPDPTAAPLRRALAAREPLPAEMPVHLYVGPEGGFSPDELALAGASGLIAVSLGPRILRTETAPLAALAALGYALGEMGVAQAADSPAAHSGAAASAPWPWSALSTR